LKLRRVVELPRARVAARDGHQPKGDDVVCILLALSDEYGLGSLGCEQVKVVKRGGCITGARRPRAGIIRFPSEVFAREPELPPKGLTRGRAIDVYGVGRRHGSAPMRCPKTRCPKAA